jgi:type II secretory pathway component PulM
VPVPESTPQAIRTRLERSIEEAGLSAALDRLQQNGSLFDLRFEAVSHRDWLVWLEQTARDARLRVVDVAVTRGASPGQVNARVSLELPARDGR